MQNPISYSFHNTAQAALNRKSIATSVLGKYFIKSIVYIKKYILN